MLLRVSTAVGGSTALENACLDEWEGGCESFLGPLEMQVLKLAMLEPLSSLHETKFRLWFRAVTGVRKPLGLANPRLETLRRLIVRLRHESLDHATNEIIAALEYGFNSTQIRIIARRCLSPPSKSVAAWFLQTIRRN